MLYDTCPKQTNRFSTRLFAEFDAKLLEDAATLLLRHIEFLL